MPDQSDVRAAILESAVEDLTGVYEAWWTVNTRHPTLLLSERLSMAEAALRSLVSDGLVTISRGSWDTQHEVPLEEVEPLLREYSTWVVGAEDNRIFFEATDAGRRAYELPA